ncbi:MAG TPA: FxLYD domain-containing protein [Candidatus Binatia bacterium]|jgi:hypothetical protein|nr:FxLYD domain-containing protein [Candidatus Binatia bacterium]
MTSTKYLKGECQHCGGHIEFPAEMAGMPSQCPHCGQQTDLLLATPPEEPSMTRRAMLWTVSAVLILGLGLGASLIALKKAQRLVRQKEIESNVQTPNTKHQTPNTKAEVSGGEEVQNGFMVSPITLEKTAGSSLVYAVGTVKNTTDRQRFGVRVELELLDGEGNKVGTAKDYQQVMEAGAEWQCKALVVESKAASAKLAGIKEEQ